METSFDASTDFPCLEDLDRRLIRTIVYERDSSTAQDEPGYIRHSYDIEYEVLLTFKRNPTDCLLNSYLTPAIKELIWQDIIPLLDFLRYRLTEDAPNGYPCWLSLSACSAAQNHPIAIPISRCTAKDMDLFWFSARKFIVEDLLQSTKPEAQSFTPRSFYVGLIF